VKMVTCIFARQDRAAQHYLIDPRVPSPMTLLNVSQRNEHHKTNRPTRLPVVVVGCSRRDPATSPTSQPRATLRLHQPPSDNPNNTVDALLGHHFSAESRQRTLPRRIDLIVADHAQSLVIVHLHHSVSIWRIPSKHNTRASLTWQMTCHFPPPTASMYRVLPTPSLTLMAYSLKP